MSELEQSVQTVQAWLEADWLRHFRRHGPRRWGSDSLVRKLKREGVCDSELAGWRALGALARHGVLDADEAAFRHRLPVRVALSEAECHRLERGFAAADASLGLDASQAVLWGHALDGLLNDWSLVDQRRLVAGLRRLAADLPGAYGLSAYVASARYLLGSSKLLEALPRELVRGFGVDPARFRGAQTHLLAAMPEAPRGLLLIENAQSFAQARRLRLDERLALVCSFGYGLSLGEALEDPARVRLVGEGTLHLGLTELLALPSLTYWGDLDPEGLRIYRRLHHHLPRLRLSALFGPMIEALESEGGHPLHRLTGKAGQAPAGAWARGLDQEWLSDRRLEALAGQALDEALEERWLVALEAEEPRSQ